MYVVLSFDDGRKDNYNVAVPIMKEHHLTATFNIATAYVDGTISDDDRPCPNEAMSIDEVQSIYRAGFEIACHGDKHRNDMDDIKKGCEKLSTWLEWSKEYKPGFASPRSNLTSDDINMKINEYKEIFSYMRISSYNKETLFNRIVRKIAHKSHNSFLYDIAFRTNIGGLRDGFIATSVPIIHAATVNQVRAIIEKAKSGNKDCILMFHSILSRDDQYYEDLWSWDAKSFDELCEWIENEINNCNLDVIKTQDLV